MQTVEDVLQGKEYPFTCHALDTLIKAAGLEYTMQGRRPMTLFAPSDLAFSQVQDCTVYDMLKDIPTLQQLLQFHIVPLALTTIDFIALGSIPATAVLQYPGSQSEEQQGIQVPTLSGAVLNIQLVPDFRVEGRHIIEADIAADNGVVHIINGLLWPVGMTTSSFHTRQPANVQEDEV